MPARIWVVIPTYNEAETIDPIVRATDAELERLVGGEHRILVVDDGSPDGTGELAEALADELGTVEVLHRTHKSGLGHAYLAGFARALDGGAELIFEMDADFSHDPRYLGDLLAAVEGADQAAGTEGADPQLAAAEGADLVLGSRYVAGGGIRDWGLARRLISRGGGLYARTILHVDVQDLTGGFKCIRRELLEAIDLPSVRAEGYVFQIEVTYRAILAGFRVREVPIVFKDRTAGSSKMSPRIAVEAMLKVPGLRRTAPAALAHSPNAMATSRWASFPR